MSIARSSTPITLLNDNFILAAGGVISNRKQTTQTELYDIKKG